MGHILAGGLMTTLVVSMWWTHKKGAVMWDLWQRVVYISFARSAWAMGLAWLVASASVGKASMARHILGWKAWQPLAKLSYAVYLIHPIVMNVFFFQLRLQEYFFDGSQLVYFVGLWGLSHVCALFLHLMVELPFANLERSLISKAGRKHPSPPSALGGGSRPTREGERVAPVPEAGEAAEGQTFDETSKGKDKSTMKSPLLRGSTERGVGVV